MTRLIRLCVDHPIAVLLLTFLLAVAGFRALQTTPVDAIPDLSEHQIVVLGEWHGRSTEDVEQQITQPLGAWLQGIPDARTVRGMSSFGMSMLYVVFDDSIGYAAARARVQERIQNPAALARLPDGVLPELGPDATPLGQIFWYALESQEVSNNAGPSRANQTQAARGATREAAEAADRGGTKRCAAAGSSGDGRHYSTPLQGPALDLAALRDLQDSMVRPALQSVPGVAEVAGVGGLVREYQVQVDPERLRLYAIDLRTVASAIGRAGLDVGGGALARGGMQLAVRGRGAIRGRGDLEEVVVALRGDGPLRLRQIADVVVGAAPREGALADERGERVGGVVTMRQGENPRQVIARVKVAIGALEPSLPPGVRIVSFYDRSELIDDTMGTLRETVLTEIVVVVAVIWLFLLTLRVSLIVATTLPLGVLLAFIAMRLLDIPSNLMSLAGIAIAIGAMDDMGIVMSENIFAHLQRRGGVLSTVERAARIVGAAREVAPAITTAVATMLVSFLPVFFLTGQAGTLFRPLAWTKTLCVLASLLVAIVLIPVLCHLLLPGEPDGAPRLARRLRPLAVGASAAVGCFIGWSLPSLGVLRGVRPAWPALLLALGFAAVSHRLFVERIVPVDENPVSQWIFRRYEPALRWVLGHRRAFAWAVGSLAALGVLHYAGLRLVWAPLRVVAAAMGGSLARVEPFRTLDRWLPPIGEAFMPSLDEGSLLYMPSLLHQASLDQTVDVMVRLNRRIREVPEVAGVMGKAGRAGSALDPAPVGMIETVVSLKPRREWRPGMTSRRVLDELREKTRLIGVAPSWLQPIEARVVMLQSDLRAAMALEIRGGSHESIARAAEELEKIVARVPGAVDVSALRPFGRPYLDLVVDRERAARFNLNPRDVLSVVEVALGGRRLAESIEGPHRRGVRLVLPPELRDDVAAIGGLLVPTSAMADAEIAGASGHGGDGPPDGSGAGNAVPLRWLVEPREVLGPALLRSENGQPTGYVMFNAGGRSEADVMQDALAAVERWRILAQRRSSPDPIAPGLRVTAAGRYLQKLEADRRLLLIVPLVLLINLGLLYLAFRRWGLTLAVFAAIPLAFGGGMLGLWIYPLLTNGGPIHLTTAVWVGFIALFGISVDDGALLGTYLKQEFATRRPQSVAALREAVVQAGLRRIRPCLMTTATTIVSLLPVLWSDGRGADVMQPMALPLLGGLVASLVTLFTVPAVFCWLEERRLARHTPPGA